MVRSIVGASMLMVALLGQEDAGGKAADAAPAKTSAAAPRRFTEFPVVDGAALDVAATTKQAIQRLIELQEGPGDDQWPYQGVYREDRDPSPVGYRVGGTALACLGLLAAPGFEQDAERIAAFQRGLRFVLKMLDSDRMQIAFVGNYDVRGWGHVYALELLLHVQDRKAMPAELVEAIGAKATWLVKALVESAIPDGGGWNYSRPRGYLSPNNRASTFMTAPALQALFHAKARGHAVPDAVVQQALDALERARAQPGGYSYGAPAESMQGIADEAKLSMMDKTPSSAARAAVCETTLLLAGRGDLPRLERAIELFFAHWDDLAKRKSQTGTHIPPYGIAPYYFLFGHVYVAQAIERLPDAGKRESFRKRLHGVLARSREDDGTWNDRQFERSAGYGTALALLTMHMARVPAPLPWTPDADATKAK